MSTFTYSGTSSVSSACLAVLQLSHIKGLGLKNYHLLNDCFMSAEKVIDSSYEELLVSGVKPKLARLIADQNVQLDEAYQSFYNRLMAWTNKQGNYLVCLEDDLYPSRLKEIYCPPPLLYIQGNLKAFDYDSISVVGSRKPTLMGQKHAAMFSRQLAEMGYCITSGLAIGVDSYAHQGALDMGGVTCAVLGSGLESIYPKQNQKLAMAIKERGVLISELSLDVKALPANFPRRNRVIAGLSAGTLVIEAGLKSGSLITADFAIEQNREVFALPGPIDNPLSKGGHELIKQGATLVDDVQDIANVIGNKHHMKQASLKTSVSTNTDYSNLTMAEQKVISVLNHQSTSFDDLVHCLGMGAGELNNLLVMLELKGLLSNVAGGYQRL